MTSNFAFLHPHFPDLHQHATHAESLIHSAPRASCFYARFTLEQAVIWLYDNDPYLRLPYDQGLGAMIHEQTFKDNLKPGLFPKIRAIHKGGNLAVHDSNAITSRDALHLAQELFHVLYWLCRYYTPNGRTLPTLTFDRALVPQAKPEGSEELSQQTLKELETQLSQTDELRRIEEKRRQQTEQQLEALQAEIAALKQQNATVPDAHDYHEADTRRYLIDVLLKEAGWNPPYPPLTPPRRGKSGSGSPLLGGAGGGSAPLADEAEAGSAPLSDKAEGMSGSPLLGGAGGGPNAGLTTEVEVTGMPSDSGNGRVDYVLWGDNGQPLALVEAKRTNTSPDSGKHQAKLYADCLEAQHGQRPIIFYTNGYETWIWDDQNYPPRQIQGFLKKDELERLIFRRTSRKRLHFVQVKSAIVNRTYQNEAIQRIAEVFDPPLTPPRRGMSEPPLLGGAGGGSLLGGGRKTLLVMATGTGKTRTAIALVDLLIRANWVKRTLFLADRTALLTQAYRAFKTHLLTVTPIDLTKNKDVDSANVVLSTYPTMLNFIERIDGNGRTIGPGHFDLVIVDEAHRSIYKKYGALFEYFDALLVGLTATPRDEVHRDTYHIFELERGNPTFAYELGDAVDDEYLVPARGVDVPFRFLRTGIRYADLSPEEQEDYEERFRDEDTGALPPQVNAAALNHWLFNKDTVDQALEILMERGLKVEGGDRLGKTIIFARNHKHAEFIVERFDTNYPHYNGAFAQIIDSKNSYAESLLDDFADPVKQPTIAVSVDMLDTGVDVPEVVNLVFFKPVYSRVKFNQMIGRGTRLCPDLFGIGHDKEEFLVFDLCGNFDFFNQAIVETDQKPADTLTTRLVKARLELAQLLQGSLSAAASPDPASSPRAADSPGSYDVNPSNSSDLTELRTSLLNDLHQHVATMEPENFLVRRHLRQVEEFSKRERWEQLSEDDLDTIADTLAPLPNGLADGDRLAKDFDLLCYKLQLSILKRTSDFVQLRDKVRDLMSQLELKRDIPMVKDQLSLIEEVQAEDWWTDVTPWMIDYVRVHLRDLVKFIDKQQQSIVYTDFEDQVGEIQDVNVPSQTTGFSPYQYRKKVEAYIRAHETHVAIAKLKRNAPLTEADLESLEDMLFGSEELEGRDRFEQVYGKDTSLKLFIRKLVGLDRNAAKQAFAQYLEGNSEETSFSANQIRFVETIIDHLTQNGVMDPGLLYEPPFTNENPEGLDGVFSDNDADQLVAIVRSFNETVGVEFGAA